MTKPNSIQRRDAVRIASRKLGQLLADSAWIAERPNLNPNLKPFAARVVETIAKASVFAVDDRLAFVARLDASIGVFWDSRAAFISIAHWIATDDACRTNTPNSLVPAAPEGGAL